MIFSNKIGKLISGKNPTLFATNSNQMNLFVFDDEIKQASIELSSILRCFKTNKTYPYNFTIMPNSEYICFCLNDTFCVKRVTND